MIQPDEIIRSNRKTLSISVDRTNRVIVRAPYRCGEERIFAFLQEKETWIRQRQAKNEGAKVAPPPENLDGYVFLLLGKPCKITLTNEQTIRYDKATHALFLPEKGSKWRLVQWLKDNAQRIMEEVTAHWAQRMQTEYKSVTISSAHRTVGSCSHDNALRYTYRLLYAPKDVIEYVAVHELAHTRHKNHSPRFWAEVAKYLPDWKEKRKWLHTHNALMQVL